MGTKQKYRLKRNYEIKKQFKFIYIFCEGEKTEVNYLNSKKEEISAGIRRRNIKIEINGNGHNTLSLVDFALDFISRNNVKIDNSTNSDECWVVFDKDDFPNFDNAIRKAEANNLKVAYSNESFELWYLLHFYFCDSALKRKDYNRKLTEALRALVGDKKMRYSKKFKDMYLLIKDKEIDAIRNAKRLLKIHMTERSFLKRNPSTTVCLLIDSLNKLK